MKGQSMRAAMVAICALLAAGCGQAIDDAPSNPAAGQSEPAPADADPAEDRVFCEEVGRRVSAQSCADYQHLAESATRGMAAFNAPDPMRRGETHTLQLAISYTPPEPAPAARDQGASLNNITPTETVDPLPGETIAFEPLVGRFMRAELSGAGFNIIAQSPASQEVTPDSVTTWTWQVEAQRGGVQALTLTTVVEGCTGDRQECLPLRSTTRNYTVTVEVSRVDQVRDFLGGLPDWIKLLSAIIVAIAGLIAAVVALSNALRRSRGSG